MPVGDSNARRTKKKNKERKEKRKWQIPICKRSWLNRCGNHEYRGHAAMMVGDGGGGGNWEVIGYEGDNAGDKRIGAGGDI